MAKLSVGFNWDPRLLNYLATQGQKWQNPVSSIYCSIPRLVPSARADDRIPKRHVDHWGILERAAKRLSVHYCLNATYYDGEQLATIKGLVARLRHIGVVWFIVAYPPVAEIVLDAECHVIWSTIKDVRDMRVLAKLTEGANIVCPSITMNRQLEWINEACRRVGGFCIELLANEFCFLDASPCNGVHRRGCYERHSRGVSKYNPYPMSVCRKERLKDPVNWLSAPFILPRWLDHYTKSITFKITGRTHPTSLVKKTAHAYGTSSDEGLLCDMWPLGKIVGEADIVPHIPIKCIPDELLLQTPKTCGSTAVCSDCRHCDRMYAKMEERRVDNG